MLHFVRFLFIKKSKHFHVYSPWKVSIFNSFHWMFSNLILTKVFHNTILQDCSLMCFLPQQNKLHIMHCNCKRISSFPIQHIPTYSFSFNQSIGLPEIPLHITKGTRLLYTHVLSREWGVIALCSLHSKSLLTLTPFIICVVLTINSI